MDLPLHLTIDDRFKVNGKPLHEALADLVNNDGAELELTIVGTITIDHAEDHGDGNLTIHAEGGLRLFGAPELEYIDGTLYMKATAGQARTP